MLFSTKVFYSLTVSLLLAFTDAAAVPGFQKRGDGIIKLEFSVNRNHLTFNNQTDTIEKRDDTYEYPLHNKDTYYVADLYIGSNGQKVSVDVDTGSSDLWVIDSESGVDASYGVYDHSKSSSYKYIAPGFEIGYADYSSAQGDWVSDKVALSPSGPSIPNQEFGDATKTDIKYGILGIGFNSLEAADSEYSNVPSSLKEQGYIKKNAYSLYLNTADSSTGSVLFGGIDKAKIDGDLVSLPVTSSTRLNINLQSVSYNGKSRDFGSDVTLDSGSTLSYLPPDVIEKIADDLGAKAYGNQFYYWDSIDDAPSEVSFDFDGISISVPKDYIAGDLYDTNGNKFPGAALKIFPDSRFSILGDNFLRNAYVVYNLDDKKISLGKVKYTDEESITVIS